MAATVQSIALVTKYAAMLDEVYKRESLTSVLDTPSDLVMWDGANAAKIFKTTMDGLGDYSRNNGYVKGAVIGTWENLQLAYDRGRQFLVDAMDNEETLDMAFGTLAGEFVRTQEVPEVDAYTFAKIASASNIQAATPANFANISNVLTAVDTAQAALDDKEVPMEGRILFVSTSVHGIQTQAKLCAIPATAIRQAVCTAYTPRRYDFSSRFRYPTSPFGCRTGIPYLKP